MCGRREAQSTPRPDDRMHSGTRSGGTCRPLGPRTRNKDSDTYLSGCLVVSVQGVRIFLWNPSKPGKIDENSSSCTEVQRSCSCSLASYTHCRKVLGSHKSHCSAKETGSCLCYAETTSSKNQHLQRTNSKALQTCLSKIRNRRQHNYCPSMA